MKKYIGSALIVLVLVFATFGMTGCATVINKKGTSQEVSFDSNPQGATVKVDGKFAGKTPAVVLLSRGENHKVEMDLEGYDHFEDETTWCINWLITLNVFNYGIGLVVDVWDGAYATIEDFPTVVLQKIQKAPAVKVTAQAPVVKARVVAVPQKVAPKAKPPVALQKPVIQTNVIQKVKAQPPLPDPPVVMNKSIGTRVTVKAAGGDTTVTEKDILIYPAQPTKP